MSYLQYALKSDRIVSVFDVESGLSCGCYCPECGARLIARKGKERVYHFAHYKVSECKNCFETALHMLAKQILRDKKQLYVPKIPSRTDYNNRLICFSEAIEEKTFDNGIRADVFLYSPMGFVSGFDGLCVEIKVSHKVDDNKIFKLFNAGISAIEIDLSGIRDNFSKYDVEMLLLNGNKTRWIYTPTAKKFFLTEWFCDTKAVKLKNNRFFYVEFCPLQGNKTVTGIMKSLLPCHDCGCNEDLILSTPLKCMGKLKGVKLSDIEEIQSACRERGLLKSIDLVVNGEKIHREYDINPVFSGSIQIRS